MAAARFSQRAELDLRLQQRGILPVYLSKEQIDRYYHRFSNGVLWPLLHYLIDRVPIDTLGWDAYREVNAAFADAVADVYADGDLIWVHDYQLMLLPALLRQRLASAAARGSPPGRAAATIIADAGRASGAGAHG